MIATVGSSLTFLTVGLYSKSFGIASKFVRWDDHQIFSSSVSFSAKIASWFGSSSKISPPSTAISCEFLVPACSGCSKKFGSSREWAVRFLRLVSQALLSSRSFYLSSLAQLYFSSVWSAKVDFPAKSLLFTWCPIFTSSWRSGIVRFLRLNLYSEKLCVSFLRAWYGPSVELVWKVVSSILAISSCESRNDDKYVSESHLL